MPLPDSTFVCCERMTCSERKGKRYMHTKVLRYVHGPVPLYLVLLAGVSTLIAVLLIPLWFYSLPTVAKTPLAELRQELQRKGIELKDRGKDIVK